MKTAKELNQAHDAREAAKVRPKKPEYNFEPLAQVIKEWMNR
jgi:hypothetical protein